MGAITELLGGLEDNENIKKLKKKKKEKVESGSHWKNQKRDREGEQEKACI